MCSLDLRKTILINLDIQLRVDTNSIALRFISSNVMYVRDTYTIAFISRNLCISKLTTRLLVFQQCRWILSTRAGDSLYRSLPGKAPLAGSLDDKRLLHGVRVYLTRLSHRVRGQSSRASLTEYAANLHAPLSQSTRLQGTAGGVFSGSYTRTSRRSTGLCGRVLCQTPSQGSGTALS